MASSRPTRTGEKYDSNDPKARRLLRDLQQYFNARLSGSGLSWKITFNGNTLTESEIKSMLDEEPVQGDNEEIVWKKLIQQFPFEIPSSPTPAHDPSPTPVHAAPVQVAAHAPTPGPTPAPTLTPTPVLGSAQAPEWCPVKALRNLKRMREEELISEAEFSEQKKVILAQNAALR